MAASTKPPPAATMTTVNDVPDKLLALILARLVASPLCLAHAAATCKRWRRIMARPSFFAKMVRGQHRRPVAGNYYNRASPQDIVFVPNPTSHQRAVGRHKFSLDFLPGGAGPWEVVDSSHSLVLLAKKKKSGWMRHCFPDLVVCEPATQRYKQIPRMEEMKHQRCIGAYLVDAERSDEYNPHGNLYVADIMTNFRVVCVIYDEHDEVSDGIGCAKACFFARDRRTTARGGIPGPRTWYAQSSQRLGYRVVLHGADSLHFLGYARGNLHWGIRGDDRRLVTLWGVVSVPDNLEGKVLRVVDSGRRDYVMFFCLQGSNLLAFETMAYSNCQLHKRLELMEATRGLVGYKEEYFGGPLKVVTAYARSIVLAPTCGTWLFSIDLDTMQVVECNLKSRNLLGVQDFPCELPWPPTVRSWLDCCARPLFY